MTRVCTAVRIVAGVLIGGIVLSSLGACAAKESPTNKDTFIFANSVEPRNFDPIFNDDGDTFRVLQQMYETLVTHRPGTAQLDPGLAEDWDFTDNGRTITFSLKRGVIFHDGTPFDADAVCYNFDRWFKMPGFAAQSNMYYYSSVWGGFSANEVPDLSEPLFESCRTEGNYRAKIQLRRYTGALPAALTLPAFAISSPTALRRYNADTVTQEGEDFTFSEYANAHPVGTGPFSFVNYSSKTGAVTLKRFDQYWGEEPKIKKLIFQVSSDKNKSRKDLLAGRIDAYDFPNPKDYEQLEKSKFQVLIRPAFNLLYLGINQKNNGRLRDIRVRKALAYAINRDRLIKLSFPKGSSVATQFIPDSVSGYADDVTRYDYNPERAEELLESANAENLTVTFYYPTSTDRPYMPNPKEIFSAISADLEAVGIKVVGIAENWETYLRSVREEGKQDLHLLGWTGDYNDPGNFVGTFFGYQKAEFGFNEPQMFTALSQADGEPDQARHLAAYEQVNRDLMEKWLPAVPIAHSPPAIAAAANVRGLFASPMTDEHFASVYKR